MAEKSDYTKSQDYLLLKDFATNTKTTVLTIIVLIALSIISFYFANRTPMPKPMAVAIGLFWLLPLFFSFSDVKKSARLAYRLLNEAEGIPATIKLLSPRTSDDNAEIEVALASQESWKLRLRPGESGTDKLELNKSYNGIAYFETLEGDEKKPYLIFNENRLIWNIQRIDRISST